MDAPLHGSSCLVSASHLDTVADCPATIASQPSTFVDAICFLKYFLASVDYYPPRFEGFDP